MGDGSRPLRRHCARSFLAGAVAAGLIITSATAYADDGDQPGPVFVPGETTQGQAEVAPSQGLPSAPGMDVADPNKQTVIQNSTPKVVSVDPYTLQDLPGTFTYKIDFFQGNMLKEQRVLAADSNGTALDPARVRVSYYTEAGEYWAFYPGTGKLDKVSGWPTVFPAPSNVAVHPLTSLFSGPGGPEWLEKARIIAVAIAAVVITSGYVAAFAPAAFALGTAAVPLLW